MHRRRSLLCRLLLLFLFLLVSVLAGCSAKHVWYNADKTAQRQQVDFYECQTESARYSADMGKAGKTSIIEKRLRQCMELKGYVWIPEDEIKK